MKKIILILTILLSKTFYAQTLESINNSDSLYIYFDYGKHQEIFHTGNNNNDILETKIYKFDINPNNIIFFVSGLYLDYDKFDKKIKANSREENRCFMKKNKSIILDINFFIKNGFKETFFLIREKKLFLIDKKEITRKKIRVKEIRIENHTYFDE